VTCNESKEAKQHVGKLKTKEKEVKYVSKVASFGGCFSHTGTSHFFGGRLRPFSAS